MTDEAAYETRIIRKVVGIKVVPPEVPTEPTVLIVVGLTDTGPLDVRLSQIAAQELLVELNKLPPVQGSA